MSLVSYYFIGVLHGDVHNYFLTTTSLYGQQRNILTPKGKS